MQNSLLGKSGPWLAVVCINASLIEFAIPYFFHALELIKTQKIIKCETTTIGPKYV